MNVSQTLKPALSQLWEGLTRPAPEIQEPDQRRQAKLLASLLALLLILGAITIGSGFVTDADIPLWQNRDMLTGLAGIVILIIPYALSRTRHYRWAAALTVVFVSLSIFIPSIPDHAWEEIFSLDYLVLSVFFASMFLSLRATVILIAAHLLALILFPLIFHFPGLTLIDFYTRPLTLNVIVSALILVATRHRDQLEKDRRAMLQASEKRFRALIEKNTDVITMVNADGFLIYDSPATTRVLGYTPDELQGRNAFELAHPDDLPENAALFAELAQTPGASLTSEFRLRHKDGSWRWVKATGTNWLTEPGIEAIVVNYHDISERKQAEVTLRQNEEIKTMSQQLWQTAKLATFGELSATIAHEINNPLTIASLRLESLIDGASADDPKLRELEVVEQALTRVAKLVADLLEFSRREQHPIDWFDVREEVTKTLEFIEVYLRRQQIRLLIEFASDVPLIHANRQRLSQVFLNLFTNAGEAMPQGGTLTVRVGTEAQANADSGQPAQVVIDVIDTGEGIPPETLSKVWEPFYTTKPEGQRTGLGLPVCRRIIEEHDGTISIQSTGIAGQGTWVRLALPAQKD